MTSRPSNSSQELAGRAMSVLDGRGHLDVIGDDHVDVGVDVLITS